tara:strand:- start:25 stop:528 length:504 start_codon:yes stop_codon:yes gene_type:complete
MNNAYKVKNQLKNIGLYSTNNSSYNSSKIVDKCEICGDEAKEVHHIKYQSSANEFNHIDNIHKNNKGNLCNLCVSCHDKVHNDELKINGYIETSRGIELSYNIIKKQEHIEIKKSKKKFNEIEINWIKNCVETNDKATYKQICGMFETVHKKKISESIIGKILKNKY